MRAGVGREGEGGLRRLLLALVMAGTLGLGAELFLLEHFESAWQWAPLGVLAFLFAAGLAMGLRPSRSAVRVFQLASVLAVAAGLVGLYLHYRGNAEFELESDAAIRGMALAWEALRGATPALAPGAMVQLGLLGLILAHRHPAVRARNNSGETR
jgi:Kef-type K+ transport system membrane component KefB